LGLLFLHAVNVKEKFVKTGKWSDMSKRASQHHWFSVHQWYLCKCGQAKKVHS